MSANRVNIHEQNAELPERRLWCAVLVQAVEDWRSANIRRQREAEAFLFRNEKDFTSVCMSAGIEAGSLLPELTKMKTLVHELFPSGGRPS